MTNFKKQFSISQRTEESKRIMAKYPDRIPIIVEKIEHSFAPDIDKHKYLVPKGLTIGQFIYVIRKRINLEPEQALFIFIDNTLPPTTQLLSDIYKNHKEKCGFLFVKYGTENCFG